jgi:prepilin-type N-terminal cleavage/methylation domain-containing protein
LQKSASPLQAKQNSGGMISIKRCILRVKRAVVLSKILSGSIEMHKMIKRDKRGFTFIEMMTVIALVGIISIWALPRMTRMMERFKARQTADTIMRQLVTARTRAIADPFTHCGVYFDTAASPQKTLIFYDRSGGTQYDYNSGIDDTYMGNYILPKGIKMALPAGGGIVNKVIVFRGDGSSKSGGTIEFKDRYNQTKKVNVLASIGRVKVIP